VLLTPKVPGAPNIGFGFALKLSQEDLCGTNLELSGYLPREEKKSNETKQNAKLDCLDAKSGLCWVTQEGSLEYDMDTALHAQDIGPRDSLNLPFSFKLSRS
jgi:hypothetical protein